MRFNRRSRNITWLLSVWLSVVALRIELSTTRLSAVSGRPALDYLVKVGHLGVEPRPCRQGDRASICTSARSSCQSERPDLNRRSPGPRPGAITRLRHVLIASDPCGSRTQPARLERPMTSPEVERAVGCASAERKWAGRRSNPRLRFFRPPLYGLSYQPRM